MNNKHKKETPLVWSSHSHQRAIGVLGIALPLVLMLGVWLIFRNEPPSSISAYYYTDMRDVLVGVLFAMGIFLASYVGYPGDAKFGKIASLGALGVALFPTLPQGKVTDTEQVIGVLHLVSTVVFFAMLIWFSWGLFTKSNQDPLPLKKRQRNLVYRICAIVMTLCVVGLVVVFFVPSAGNWLGGRGIFWFESFAIWSFGVSWFTKGGAIKPLNDPPGED